MKKSLKTLKLFLIVILSLALLFIAGSKIAIYLKSQSFKDEILLGFEDNLEEVIAEQKNTQSDIEGWSVYDKVEAGLSPVSGADTDGDGLTDKEEIEVYNTDPKKASTAGDLYLDSYKVANGMDVNTYCEYEGNPEYKYNECNEVILNASCAEGLFAHVSSSFDNAFVEGYEIYKAYRVYHFTGNVTIDVTDIVPENENSDDIIVLVGNSPSLSTQLEKVKFSLDGSYCTLDYSFEHSGDYFVALGKATSKSASKNPRFDVTRLVADYYGDVRNANYLYVHYLGILNAFGNYGNKPRLYYVPTGNEVLDHNTELYLVYLAEDVLDGYVEISVDDVEQVSSEKMALLKAKIAPYKNIFSFYSMEDLSGEKFTPQYIFCEINDTFVEDLEFNYVEQLGDVDITNTCKTSFDTYKDELPFYNFGSVYSERGNCAGIAYYTAFLFNNKYFPSSGSYTFGYDNGYQNVSWDISQYSDNETLLDEGLYNYKGKDFTKKHSDKNGILVNLSPDEDEFQKMIAAYWAEVNYRLACKNYWVPADNGEYGYYSWELIEDMKTYLRNNQILGLAMESTHYGGHMVNVIGYAEKDDYINFYLYDSNYPNDEKPNAFGGTSCIPSIVTVSKKTCESGYTESFTFSYVPYEGCDIVFNSDGDEDGYSRFVVMDTDFNVLNDKYLFDNN